MGGDEGNGWQRLAGLLPKYFQYLLLLLSEADYRARQPTNLTL